MYFSNEWSGGCSLKLIMSIRILKEAHIKLWYGLGLLLKSLENLCCDARTRESSPVLPLCSYISLLSNTP